VVGGKGSRDLYHRPFDSFKIKIKEHMIKRFWIKLYMEILDDDKFGTLPEFIKWRAIELFLVAGENGNDGLLPPVARLAWRLRLEEVKIAETLSALTQIGVVHETPEGWVVTNFSKRQERVEGAERTRLYRERLRNSDESVTKRHEKCDDDVSLTLNLNSSSISDSDSEEGGVGGETKKPPGDPVEEEFSAHFGSFYSKRERERWQTLSEAIGFPRLQEIADWAEKREIHMTNRGALLDSLETAAKKWIDNNPKLKGDNSEFFKSLAIAAEVKT
jgi:hypothetical protein